MLLLDRGVSGRCQVGPRLFEPVHDNEFVHEIIDVNEVQLERAARYLGVN